MIPNNFNCIPIDGQEFESEILGRTQPNQILFKEFYLIDADGNAFKCKSDNWLVSKFIEVENDIFSVGNPGSFLGSFLGSLPRNLSRAIHRKVIKPMMMRVYKDGKFLIGNKYKFSDVSSYLD